MTEPTVRPDTIDTADLPTDRLPHLPQYPLDPAELRDWVDRFAADRELWAPYVRHDAEGRYFVSLYRDTTIDVWLLCWDCVDDTGWHDHDTSSGAVAVVAGTVNESQPCLGGEPQVATYSAGHAFGFGPDHIHRMQGAEDGSVTIHAYSPPLWRMGQYSISDSGVMRRVSVSYADELRPLDA